MSPKIGARWLGDAGNFVTQLTDYACEEQFPLGKDFQYELFRCPNHRGLVLHIQVSRTQNIVKASDGIPYLRRGAQNLPQTTPEELKRLEYAKGVSSFEGHTVKASKELITGSAIIKDFLQYVVPNAEAEVWLKKQALIANDRSKKQKRFRTWDPPDWKKLFILTRRSTKSSLTL